MFGKAINVLREMGIHSISTYVISMGSIFALLTAVYIGGIYNVVLCSPSHVPFHVRKSGKGLPGILSEYNEQICKAFMPEQSKVERKMKLCQSQHLNFKSFLCHLPIVEKIFSNL